MCVRVLPPIEMAVVPESSTERFFPATEWFPSTGIDDVIVQMFVRNASSNVRVRPGVEWAQVRTDNPVSTITGIGSAPSSYSIPTRQAITFSAGEKGNKFYMRLGVLALSSDGGQSYGEVTMVPTLNHCGRVVGAQEVVVNPGLGATTEVSWFEISEWFPLANISKAKAAFIVQRCNSAQMRYILGCRTAINPATPNDWVEMESGTYTAPGTGNSERNTDEESFPAGANVSSNVYGQLGLGVKQASAAELRAIFKAAAAIVYS